MHGSLMSSVADTGPWAFDKVSDLRCLRKDNHKL